MYFIGSGHAQHRYSIAAAGTSTEWNESPLIGRSVGIPKRLAVCCIRSTIVGPGQNAMIGMPYSRISSATKLTKRLSAALVVG